LFIQEFDSALRRNVHLLSLDGMYVRAEDGALRFHELAEPSAEDVAEARRLVTVLTKHGREVEAELGGPVAIAYGVDVHAAVCVHEQRPSPTGARSEVVPKPPSVVANPLFDDDDGGMAGSNSPTPG
jgi:hypothetical protein